MRNLIVALLLTSCYAVSAQELSDIGSVSINGYVGNRIAGCIDTRVKGQDVEHLTEPFTHKNDTASWQTEFWGKWVQGAIASYRYKPDPELYKMIEESVDRIIATQQPDGYIGNYAPDAHLLQWDVWGRKYVALGLMAWYRLSGDKKALEATSRLIDHVMTEIGPEPGKADIALVGNYHGMAASSILEPVVYLYKATGEPRYLDFANYIVGQWETPQGPQLISKALEGVDVAARFPHPDEWFSPENGQKAYEMMSCYVGLLELYKITGNTAYLDVVEKAVGNIIDKEINIAGSGSSFESWYHGKDFQTRPTYHTMETCVTFTWMQLLDKLLTLTGKPSYADQIERTLYNALMASLKDDASQIAKYSPIEGHRFEGEEQCGMHINCCNANGPRGFAMIPEFAVKHDGDKVFLNYYGDMVADVDLGAKRSVKITETGNYPVGNRVDIAVEPSKAGMDFALNLRIPVWSADTKVSVNGQPVAGVCPGSYMALSRKWQKGDRVTVEFDMPVRVVEQDMMQAVTRGPIVFARDSRYADGFVDETAVVEASADGIVEGAELVAGPGFAWMTLSVPVTVGSNLEGTDAERKVNFCDFASSGNTWDPAVRYRVWIPRTFNVRLERLY